jgi:hypothetical protein
MSSTTDVPSAHIVDRCPTCGGTMESGFLISQRGLAWSLKRRRLWMGGVDWIISPWGVTPSHFEFPAQKCVGCGLVVFRRP